MFENRTVEELKRNAYVLHYKLEEILLCDDDLIDLSGISKDDFYSMIRMMRRVVVTYIEEVNLRVDPNLNWLSDFTIDQLCSKWKGEQNEDK